MTKMDLRLSKFKYSCPYRAGDLHGEIPESWDCIDCGINSAPGSSTEPRWNKPMTADWNKQGVKQTVDNWSEVKPAVWKAVGMGEMDGCLCIGCLDAEGLPPQRSLQLNARHQAAAGTARRHLITTSGAALQIAARFMQILSRAPAVTRSAPRGPSNPRREAMTDQEQIEEVLHRAAVPIAIEIDNMLSRLPTDADPIEVANDLIAELAACCGHPEFIALFADAFAARQALTELGIKF